MPKPMKTFLPSLTVVGALLLGVAGNLHAQPYAYAQPSPYDATRFYVNADVGGSLLQNLKIKNFAANISFEPGARGDFSVGYNIIGPMAVEFETGSIWNSLDGPNRQALFPGCDRVDLFQVPFLGNLVFRVPLQCGLTPYIGAGLGGVASTLEVRFPRDQGFRHHESDTDFTFAYQGMAGLKYAFASNMEVDVGYKFLGTLDHSWFDTNPFLITQTRPTYSHSILASFTYKF
jgi:opacity protein-like surface antigen